METLILKNNLRSIFSGFSPTFVLAHFCNHLVIALPIPLLPFITREFNLSYTQAGLVITAFTLAYGISQLPAGFIADRAGHRNMITFSIVGIGLAGLLVGLTHSYMLMLIFLVIMGIAGGGYHPAAPPLLAASVSPEIRGKAFGFHIIGGNGAYFLAPLAAAGIAAFWGWRMTFIALAIPTIIFGFIFYWLLSRRIIKKIEYAAINTEEVPQPRGWWRQLVIFLILAALASSLSASASSFIALFAQYRFGVSEAAAAIYVAFLNSSGLWAAPLGGYFSDRIGTIPSMLIVCLATGPVIYLLTVTPIPGFIAGLLLWGALTATRMPATEAYIMSQSSPRLRSRMFGIYYFSTQHGSGILAPILGVMIDHFGFNSGFVAVAVATLLITVICGAFLWKGRLKPSSYQA